MIKYTLGILFGKRRIELRGARGDAPKVSWHLAPFREVPERRGDLEKNNRIGMDFLAAVEKGDYDYIDHYIASGSDVNFQHPITKQTALHLAAGYGDRTVVRSVIGTGNSEFSLKDNDGKTAADIAFEHGIDPVIARYLAILQRG